MSGNSSQAWGLYKSVFSVLLLVSSTFLFCMEEGIRQAELLRAESIAVAVQQEDPSGLPPLNDPNWQDKLEVDEVAYRQRALAETEVDSDSGSSVDSKKEEDLLEEWLVGSCLENMPPLLKGIYSYLKSGAPDDPRRVVRPFHRFLLVGPPGTSKSTTAEAMAQSLGYKKEIVGASSLLGAYRSHTAINIRDLFKRLRGNKRKTMLIINELHKLFEGHTNQHTDHAESAMCFWEQLDEVERCDLRIVTVVTANHVDKFPPELKGRFRGQWILMPQLSGDRLIRTFDDIVAQDRSIRVDDAVRESIRAFCSGEKKYSFRDVKLLVDTAKMFAYAEQSEADSLVLTSDLFKQALHNFDDPERVMKFEEKQIDEQEQRHRETLELQDQLFVQQKLIEVEKEIEKELLQHIRYHREHNIFERGHDFSSEKQMIADQILDKLRLFLYDRQKVILEKMLEMSDEEEDRQEKEAQDKERAAAAQEQAKTSAQSKPQASAKKADSCVLM